MSKPLLSDRVREVLDLLDAAIADACKQLEAQPDNPLIRRFGAGRVVAFAINFSDLGISGRNGTSWSVFEHDHLAQYRYARELLESRRFSALRDLLASRSYHDRSNGVKAFAPEVIDRIKAITGDLADLERAVGARHLGKDTASGSAPDDNGVSRRVLPSGVVVESAEPRQTPRTRVRP